MAENERPASWSDLFAKTMELGLGALHLTKETGQRLVSELEERGQMSRQQATEFINRMREAGREQQRNIEDMINRAVEHALDRADVARRSEIAELRERIAALEADRANIPATDVVTDSEGEVAVRSEASTE